MDWRGVTQREDVDACQSNVLFESLLSGSGHAAPHQSAPLLEVQGEGAGQSDGP